MFRASVVFPFNGEKVVHKHSRASANAIPLWVVVYKYWENAGWCRFSAHSSDLEVGTNYGFLLWDLVLTFRTFHIALLILSSISRLMWGGMVQDGRAAFEFLHGTE